MDLNVLALVRNALTVLFLCVSLLILATGLVRRTSFKHVRISWSTGRLFGLPLGPTVFLACTLALVADSLATGDPILSISWTSATAYVFGGLSWYIGALLLDSTLVTDWGISTTIGGRQVVLPWHEVTDYVATPRRRRVRYVFFKVDEHGFKRRFEVLVPFGVKDRFQSIVEFKLDSRFDRSAQQRMGQRALEQ